MKLPLSPLVLAVTATLASAQIVHDVDGPISALLGARVDGGEDVDGDGVPDLLMTAPSDETFSVWEGSIQVRSGVDASLLHYFGTDVPNGFAQAGALLGDLTGDGRSEFVVGAWLDDEAGNNSGRAWVYSGADASVVYELWGPTGSTFGFDAGPAGDADGDGIGDFFVSANNADGAAGENTGLITVFSGATGGVLFALEGDAVGTGLSEAAAAGDVNGDGRDDLIVGNERDHTLAQDAGSARVHSGVDGSVLWTFMGEAQSDFCGRQVAGAGDVNADGFADVLVASSGNDEAGDLAGKVRVFSGADGSLLHSFLGFQALDAVGGDVAGVGDVNGDGLDDVAIASHRANLAESFGGYVRVHSGADGALLRIWFGTEFMAQYGQLAAAGDVDGDGVPDLMVGAPQSDVNSGRVFVYSGAEQGAQTFCFGDATCPCGNPDPQAGCANSTGAGAYLIATGTASVAAGELAFVTVDLPQGANGLLIASLSQTSMPFFDGRLCLGPPIQRLAFDTSAPGSTLVAEQPFPPTVTVNPGFTAYFQTWYRDSSGPCGAGANLTNGVRVAWQP